MNKIRLQALLRKESRQMLRDPSTFAIGIVLPIIMMLIFGFGISLDLKQAKIAVINQDKSPLSYELITSLRASTYLEPQMVQSMLDAQNLLKKKKVNAILHLQNDFAAQYQKQNGQIQLIVDGIDASNAAAVVRYVNGALLNANLKQAARFNNAPNLGIYPLERIWFNAANSSTWYLVPGLIALIMTLVGAFLTATLVAREWERSTFEMLFATPVSSFEIIIAKIVPYLAVGFIGLILCLIAALGLFKVPLQGSLGALLFSCVLYLLVALSMGIAISAITRNQFLACQIVVIATFLPAALLSGFLFDLRNTPFIIQTIGEILPATHFMQIVKTSFLAGDNWSFLLKKWLILLFYIFFFLNLARLKTRKLLE